MLYLHPERLTPDPTAGRQLEKLDGSWYGMTVWPHAVAAAASDDFVISAWNKSINIFQPHQPLVIDPVYRKENDIVIDFGTELEGELELTVKTGDSGTISVSFGESKFEAREWGLPSTCREQRPRKSHWEIYEKGTHTRRFEQGGLRFARIRCIDFSEAFVFQKICVYAKFMYENEKGAFECSDKTFQRIWHSSVYTARLCSRPDAFWDGIKRDRIGWYGDARITKETADTVYFDPSPSIPMMKTLPVDTWANSIPNYSFDCLAMLRQHILFYGTDNPELKDVWDSICAFMNWVIGTQVDKNGMIAFTEPENYFFGIGFTDWSPQPLGGRFEELACLQFSWLECLRDAEVLAGWFSDEERKNEYTEKADRLSAVLKKNFWEEGLGFHHTLNLCEPPDSEWRMPGAPQVHYTKTYKEKLQYGPSGPTFQSCSRAVFAGLCGNDEKAFLRKTVFGSSGIPDIITSYYKYYQNWARAVCGDTDGALMDLHGYFGPMLEEHDSGCIWESYEPDVDGIQAYGLGSWPKSLCHGWGSGTVPITRRFLFGIDIREPGMKEVRLSPESSLDWTFSASLPTPFGILKAEKEKPEGPVVYSVPDGMEYSAEEGAVIT